MAISTAQYLDCSSSKATALLLARDVRAAEFNDLNSSNAVDHAETLPTSPLISHLSNCRRISLSPSWASAREAKSKERDCSLGCRMLVTMAVMSGSKSLINCNAASAAKPCALRLVSLPCIFERLYGAGSGQRSRKRHWHLSVVFPLALRHHSWPVGFCFVLGEFCNPL